MHSQSKKKIEMYFVVQRTCASFDVHNHVQGHVHSLAKIRNDYHKKSVSSLSATLINVRHYRMTEAELKRKNTHKQLQICPETNTEFS